MSKAKEISALYKDIKQQMGKLVSLCHEVEDHAEATEAHAEVTADAYQRGYETAKHECEDFPKQAYIDAIRMEAYQQGLNVLWEAMQKAIKMYCEIDNEVFLRVFHDVKCDWGESVLQALFKNTPQHVIDSIREYEQRQKEQIQVGDEVDWMGDKYVVTYVRREAKKADLISCQFGNACENVAFSALGKTGRHFPEIAEVLRKMKESE